MTWILPYELRILAESQWSHGVGIPVILSNFQVCSGRPGFDTAIQKLWGRCSARTCLHYDQKRYFQEPVFPISAKVRALPLV